ncbi:MAG: helix-turn-helix domain-containing protein [Bacteroidota bacterium]
MNEISLPAIGAMLRAYVKKHRIYQSAWARKAGQNEKTIARYQKRPDMRVSTLFRICQTLNYNFFREIAALLPSDMPPLTDNILQPRITDLEKQVHDLELQVKTLKEALELVGKK